MVGKLLAAASKAMAPETADMNQRLVFRVSGMGGARIFVTIEVQDSLRTQTKNYWSPVLS